MKYRSLEVGIIFLIAGRHSALLGDTCESSDEKDTLRALHVDDVRPTQFSVGSLAVTCKADNIADKSKKNFPP